jgi:hypothetical protein
MAASVPTRRSDARFGRHIPKRLTAEPSRPDESVTMVAYCQRKKSDLVVEGDCKRLAIECDGDRYYPLEKLPEDMDRQSVLERMGWIFTRIRSSELLRNPARTMKPVFEKLQMLEIPPTGNSAGAEPAGVVSHDVIDRVIRRAEELRRNWSKANGSGARSPYRTAAAATV